MSMRDKMKGIFQIDGGDDEFYDDDEGYLDEPEPMFKKSASREADDGEESDSIAKRVPRISKPAVRVWATEWKFVLSNPQPLKMPEKLRKLFLPTEP